MQIKMAIIGAIIMAVAATGAQAVENANLFKLWYQQPAKTWLEAVPIGNGRVGAMVYGGVEQEKIALNEVTLWSGEPSIDHVNLRAQEAFASARKLMLESKPQDAGKYIDGMLGRESNYGTNMPGGDLLINQKGVGVYYSYYRELDLDSAVSICSFTSNGTQFKREAFVSHPDGVLALRFSADSKSAVSFNLGYDGGKLPCEKKTQGNDTLIVTGHAYGPHSNGKCGVGFQITFKIIPEGGVLSADNDKLKIEKADAVTVLVAFNTDYKDRIPGPLCADQISNAAKKTFEQLRAAHIADHQKLFRRVAIDLGGSEAAQTPTDQRLDSVRKGNPDPALAALLFQYGRYLTIAGSREDSPLPMHLQGIWNDNLACNMGWTCDYHLDINTQQNYWAAESCNLSECGAPLFRLIESLVDSGHRTAKIEYDISKGWVCHVFTNAWGFTAPGWGWGWGLHVTGGAWIATHLWEHYLYTGDKAFLENQAYPVLKGSAEFFLEYLFKDPATGYLITGPSVSPEMGGETNPSATHDRAMIYEIFSACIEASSKLGIDADFRGKLEAARAKLPPYQIGRNGQLQEWLKDDGGETNHRHTSHLVGLFPLDQIDPLRTPDLAKAADKSLQLRMDRGDWEDVEWSRANAICYHARLLQGDKAEASVTEFIKKLCRGNLMGVSVAGVAGAGQDIFAIDGNTASAAGIAEMLMQSHNGEIALLPALPKAWPSGSIKGLKARGGFVVNEFWQNGKLTGAIIKSLNGNPCKLRLGDKVIEFNTRKGGNYKFDGALRRLPSI